MSDDVTWLDYDELARAFGIERESARRLVMRKRWARSKGNDGKARVGVPTDALPPVTPSSTGERPAHAAGEVTGEGAVKAASTVPGEAGASITGTPKPDTVNVTGDESGQSPADVTVTCPCLRPCSVPGIDIILCGWR